jgi:metal-responsive CopG/Arc/MetJ family transcriptional regulator
MKHKLPVDKSVTFRIQDDLLVLFDKTADERELSRSQYIRKLILRELSSSQLKKPLMWR